MYTNCSQAWFPEGLLAASKWGTVLGVGPAKYRRKQLVAKPRVPQSAEQGHIISHGKIWLLLPLTFPLHMLVSQGPDTHKQLFKIPKRGAGAGRGGAGGGWNINSPELGKASSPSPLDAVPIWPLRVHESSIQRLLGTSPKGYFPFLACVSRALNWSRSDAESLRSKPNTVQVRLQDTDAPNISRESASWQRTAPSGSFHTCTKQRISSPNSKPTIRV